MLLRVGDLVGVDAEEAGRILREALSDGLAHLHAALEVRGATLELLGDVLGLKLTELSGDIPASHSP